MHAGMRRSGSRRRLPIRIARVALSIGLVAGAVALLARGLAERVLFQPSSGMDLRPEQLGLDAEELYLSTDDGVRVHAFWLPAPGADRAILFLHGNAGNASHRLPNAGQLVRLRAHVLLLDYRGYGLSEGSPSEEGVYADARAGLEHIARARALPPERTVLFGRSLGAAVAVDLAQDRPLAWVILESGWSSLADVAGQVLRLPVGGLLGGMFDSAAKISRVRAPLLFFHGDRDRTVPIELGQRLYAAAPEPKAFWVIRTAGHNDTILVGGRAYFERFQRFLDEVAP